MNVKWRLAFRLIVWLTLAGIALLALAGGAVYWSYQQLMRIETARDFENAGLYRLVQTLRNEGGDLTFDPELLSIIRDSGGWLQRIDENGRVTDAYFTPPDVPDAYGPGELVAYWMGKTEFPYPLYLWIQEKDGVTHTLVYGLSNEDDRLLEQFAERGEIGEGSIALPEELANRLRRSGAWLQVLDSSGAELASSNKPPGALGRYSLQELALRSVYADRYGAKLTSFYEEATGRTWVLSEPLSGFAPGEGPLFPPEAGVIVAAVGGVFAAAMAIFALVAYGFGHRFGAPIVHMLNWIRALDEGKYAEPAGRSGPSRSRNRRGRTKGGYRVFGDVVRSLDSLSETLRRNERLRAENERLKDEWIAGVSHDLKTPLSSIKGYAHMLNADAYEWTAEEVRSFAKVILDKSSHLDELINDLTLTYHLRHGGRPPSLETVDMNDYLAEAVRDASSHPQYPENGVRFAPDSRAAWLDIYRPWFQRIVDNLVANALLHNREGTMLTVSVRAEPDGGLSIRFADDGDGMDERTAERLFERYYRGTDTESRAEGTGLGMAVTKALVEGLGGTIEVDTAPGRGTAIVLRWDRSLPENRAG
ncbi:sensor histidine kinase [Cohnella algarum]|uniref:sensor histidine kinase n=1 Tax=Cohnella algarum TaxID=2044859 RepID=UPI0019678E9C|nr:HAMP domain-containing sensor histidine kinase [Cohnella algarum]MBN2980172.1 HAMP domain-containing histidine kinase [Cohnella algarum]